MYDALLDKRTLQVWLSILTWDIISNYPSGLNVIKKVLKRGKKRTEESELKRGFKMPDCCI